LKGFGLGRLGVGGGLFGLDRLAGHVLNLQRQSLGLGANIGGMRAFDLFGKTFLQDPQSVLGGMAAAQRGITSPQYQSLVNLGMNPQQIRTADPTQLALEAIRRSLPILQQGGRGPAGPMPIASALGLTSFLSPEDITALSGREGPELVKQLEEQVKANKELLDIQKANTLRGDRAKPAIGEGASRRFQRLRQGPRAVGRDGPKP
jgi:hypothetical protein